MHGEKKAIRIWFPSVQTNKKKWYQNQLENQSQEGKKHKQHSVTPLLSLTNRFALQTLIIKNALVHYVRHGCQTGVLVSAYGVATGLIGVLNSILHNSPSPLHSKICCDRSSLFFMLPRIRRIRGSIHPFWNDNKQKISSFRHCPAHEATRNGITSFKAFQIECNIP